MFLLNSRVSLVAQSSELVVKCARNRLTRPPKRPRAYPCVDAPGKGPREAASTRRHQPPHALPPAPRRASLGPLALNLQSHRISRSYTTNLPTSLTYFTLSTRGCSPWVPDADTLYGQTKDKSIPSDFPGPFATHRMAQKLRHFAGLRPASPAKPIPRASHVFYAWH